MQVEIKLSQDKVAIIDEEDLFLVHRYKWSALSIKTALYEKWYATTSIDGKTTYMHRLIMGEPEGKQIDHIDQDGLNNRRDNLRIVNNSENARNTRAKRKRATKHSKYKGVSWHALKKPSGWIGGRWRAEIELPGRKRKIRYANSEIEAAKAYNELALQYFGDHARLNIL